MAENFFLHLSFDEEHILGQESPCTLPESRRDINLLENFLRTNNKDKKLNSDREA